MAMLYWLLCQTSILREYVWILLIPGTGRSKGARLRPLAWWDCGF